MPKQITLEWILKEFRDFYWETGKYEKREHGIDQYEDFITTYFTQFAESFELKELLKEHICRFNDGEQVCPCYLEAKAAVDERVYAALNKPSI